MQVAERSLEFKNVTRNEWGDIATQLLQQAKEHRIWLFIGEMGAGKTTLIKEFCKVLGVEDTMSSPTFSIVNEYGTQTDQKVFHFDFYRIQREQEALDIGVEEYFYSGAYCFVEWPERIPDLIPDAYVVIKLTITDTHHRNLSFTPHG